MNAVQKEMEGQTEEQAEFYNYFYSERSPQGKKKLRVNNLMLTIWELIRLRLKRFGNETQIFKKYHRQWIEQNRPKIVLELGCGPGSSHHLWVAKNCDQYIGIDISSEAINLFEDQLNNIGLKNTTLRCMDFMKNDFPDNFFDMISACGVIHHFADLDHLCEEMIRVLKPGGFVITWDPLNTTLSMKILRLCYRPWQRNKDWEWPFIKKTFKILKEYFAIEEIRGITGVSKYGFLLSFVPGCRLLATHLFELGVKYDGDHAVKECNALWRCLRVTMLLRSKKTA